jgi:CRP/FNR family transcriptional regulator, cyclic AMP receptor protein
MKDTSFLKAAAFFSGLSEEDLEKIAGISIERKYKKNTIVFIEGDPGESFYYVKSGKVKVFRTYEDGREHILLILGEGGIFGEATMFSGLPYPASAAVYEDAVIGIIRNRELEELVKESPELSLKLVRLLASKLLQAQYKIRDLTFNDVFSRTASQILKLSEEHGRNIGSGILVDIQLSRQELAEMAGTTRETVSRAVSRFKKEKSIGEQDDKLVILNAEKLKTWI